MTKIQLKKLIAKKLTKLQELLDKFDEAKVISSDEPDTWDTDTLYNLTEELKETLALLEDQEIKGKYDNFGNPLTEPGLCSLVDEYQEESEEKL